MKRLDVTLADTVKRMVGALEDELDHRGIAYATVAAVDNVNAIDDVTDHCGEVRCEHFADLGWEYASQFGEFAGPAFEKAQGRVVTAAWKAFQRKHRS